VRRFFGALIERDIITASHASGSSGRPRRQRASGCLPPVRSRRCTMRSPRWAVRSRRAR
jgi:hypothetical protein